eukprot:NODE_18551_length_887_cov_3.356579.p1 GENE.NODE_18551_length_887_cov_3.356579~~NODE_18551_length_887_cov_3.356579.p1  ORF type:complete len:295 (+),score=27.55 NODE_18551_length_887_cov_3.356579:135-887(+)
MAAAAAGCGAMTQAIPDGRVSSAASRSSATGGREPTTRVLRNYGQSVELNGSWRSVSTPVHGDARSNGMAVQAMYDYNVQQVGGPRLDAFRRFPALVRRVSPAPRGLRRPRPAPRLEGVSRSTKCSSARQESTTRPEIDSLPPWHAGYASPEPLELAQDFFQDAYDTRHKAHLSMVQLAKDLIVPQKPPRKAKPDHRAKSAPTGTSYETFATAGLGICSDSPSSRLVRGNDIGNAGRFVRRCERFEQIME